jgi:hypothetical protein
MSQYVKVILEIPRKQKYTHYINSADQYLNLPIVINEKSIGVITKILDDNDDYIKVEGFLYNAGTSYLKQENLYSPFSFEII